MAELLIYNPGRKNAMSGKMLFELASVVDQLLYDKLEVNCVILRSGTIEKEFCSGLDLNLAKHIINTADKGLRMCEMMTDTLNRLRNSSLISVALVEGPAIGGGAELTTACDFRIMSASAYCQFVHGQLGVTPGWGGLNRLISIVGRNNALKLLGTSLKLPPDKALEMNFADEIIPVNEKADALIERYLSPYLAHPYPSALKALKKTVSLVAEDIDYRCNKIEEEQRMFHQRWSGKDNASAIEQKHSNKGRK